MKVAVVYGGFSSERNASAENAEYIGAALKRRGYEVYPIHYEKDLIKKVKDVNADVVYVCVQGKWHGDGTIQAILGQEGILFTGSDSHAAALINDKIVSKLLFERAKVSTPDWQILTKEEYAAGKFNPSDTGYPFVAKAPSEGGSFGIALVRNEAELGKIEEVFKYESPILIEKFIPGRFFTVGILEREDGLFILPCVEGIEICDEKEQNDPDRLKVFTGDYTSKPAQLPAEVIEEMNEMAVAAYKITGARGIARIDFMVSEDGMKPYALEINAVPGLKPRSLLPGAARVAGIEYDELIEGVLKAALRNSAKEGDN